MKRVFMVLAVAVLCGAGLSPALRDILAAEHARSLDGGKLAAALDGPPAVAARAALAIGRTRLTAGAPALRAHLQAAEPATRAMVVYGLGLLADRASLTRIQALSHTDPNSAVRYAAADAMGRIAAAGAVAALGAANVLITATEHDPDATVRGHAAASLDAFRATHDAQRIAFALQHAFRAERDETVRWHIMWTLSRAYATTTARSFFQAALAPRYGDTTRLEAVRGIGRQNDVNAIPLLRPLLDDPSWRVQEEANEAIRRLTGKALTAHLTAFQDGLHLPPLPPPGPAPTAPARPPLPVKMAAPSLDTVVAGPPLLPTSAALMNGPMPGPHPRIRFDTTQGPVVVRLYPEWAPYTVTSFLAMTNAGYFDGNRWFRIVPDFVVQTGDHTNTGDGSAGFAVPAEENPVEQRAGIIALGLDYDDKTNTPLRDSAGSQFYITLSPQLHLDRDFSVFGEVQSGFDVLPHLLEADKIIAAVQIADD